jgi:hypothetical protein
LAGTVSLGHPELSWTACPAIGQPVHSVVVRSSDAEAAWPLGAGDTSVGGMPVWGGTSFSNTDVPPGASDFYRVFCVTDNGWTGVTASNTVRVAVPPDHLGITITPAVASVKIGWPAACVHGSARVARSSLVTQPSAAPATRSTTVVSVVLGTFWVDTTDYPAGTTMYYRVQCVLDWEGVLIATAASGVVSSHWAN